MFLLIITLILGLFHGSRSLQPVPPQGNAGACASYKFGNLLYLGPAKTMTQMMANIHCEIALLKRDGRITAFRDRRLNTGFGNICFPEQRREMMATSAMVPFTGWRDKERFFIWRDPVDRFLSIYAHMCEREHLCGEAGKNVHTFARGVYRILKDGNFPLGARDQPRLRHHISPQSWYCDISKHHKTDKVIEYTNNRGLMKKRLVRVFRSTDIPRWIWQRALRRIVRKDSQVNLNSHRKYNGHPVTSLHLPTHTGLIEATTTTMRRAARVKRHKRYVERQDCHFFDHILHQNWKFAWEAGRK
ncbi:unnamed protein product, partial [Mesorhabditis belari]|uniref:Uncharacterized protein n=1 Tax=Mesorhabditis belari TaxID=2138241 RepID=A0AAF3FIC0_9BILA